MADTDSNVHVYSATREQRLLQLVCFLWGQLTPQQQLDFEPDIEAAHMGWAIPVWECRDPEDRLTVEELAVELGMTPSGIRNWQHRYDLKPVNGRYRWADIQDVRKRLNQPKRQQQAG